MSSLWKVDMSYAKEVQLCQMVAKHRCLYDARNPLFKDTAFRDKVWEEIGEQLKLSGEICKNRWRNIRDSYWRNKRMGANTSGKRKRKWFLRDHVAFLDTTEHKRRGASNTSPSQSEEDTDSTFSNLVTDSGDTIEAESIDVTKIELPEMEDTSDEHMSSVMVNEDPLSSATNLREISAQDRNPVLLEERQIERDKACEQCNMKHQGANGKEDDVDLFLRSMGMTMKTFRPAILAETKKRICNLVMDMQMENEKFQTVS